MARGNLEASSFKYKELADKLRPEIHFQVGDYVWAMHSKERFQTEQYNKLKLRKIGPVEVLEKINPNAYRLPLPSHVHTTDVLNVKHLFKHEPNKDLLSGFVDDFS